VKGTMKAIIKAGPARGAELRMVDIPSIGTKDVLIKVKVCSICGTDLHIYQWNEWASNRIKPPLIFGHEFAGVIVEKGCEVPEVFSIDDYVSGECHVTCGVCAQCRTGQGHICQDYKILGVDFNGAFAEYVRVPYSCLWKNNPQVSPELASIQDPFGNALMTVSACDIRGKSVLVNGCGAIGLFAVIIARFYGASAVYAVDVNKYKLDLAKKLGAGYCLNPLETDVHAKIKELTEGLGIDVVLEMAGTEKSFDLAFKILKNGGHISILGIPDKPLMVDFADKVVFKGATLHGITGREIFKTWYQTAAFLNNPEVDITPVLTHRFTFENFREAFELMESGKSGKIVLYPDAIPK